MKIDLQLTEQPMNPVIERLTVLFAALFAICCVAHNWRHQSGKIAGMGGRLPVRSCIARAAARIAA